MDTNNQEFFEDEEVQKTPVRKKKKKKGLIIFLVILVLVIAGGAGYYFYERQKPIETTKDFLENMRAMTFDRSFPPHFPVQHLPKKKQSRNLLPFSMRNHLL